MKTQQSILSIKIIYWITNFTFWMYSVVAVIMLFVSVALFFGIFDDLQLHIGLPISVDLIEKGSLTVSSTVIGVELVEMYGKVHFIDTPIFIGKLYGGFLLAIVTLTFYIFFIFRKFVTNVYLGAYFKLSNIALLKKIAYALLVIWFFTISYAYFQYYYIAKNLEFESLIVVGDVKTSSEILLIALFIWVLSHIFQKGLELQEENDLTI